MSPWCGIAGVVLVAVAVAGCRADTAAPSADPSAPGAGRTAPSASVSPAVVPAAAGASLQAPLGAGTFDADPSAFRDAVLQAIATSGVRTRVTGVPHPLTFERPAGRGELQRVSWREDGTVRVQQALTSGRVCVNRAEARALEQQGDRVYSVGDIRVAGTFLASDRPYSCTRRPRDLDVGGLLTTDLRRPDPVSRLGSIGIEPEELHLTDLGIESDGGTTARHLRLAGVETDVSGARVPTTFDLWVDGDLHLVRAEFSRLDSLPGRYAASFTYGVPTVSRPAARDRGLLALEQAPPALQVSTTDPVGDVDISRPKSWFVPSLDITTFQTTYEAASRTMQFRIGFADLLELKHRHARFEQRITISNSRTSGQFYFERTVRGDSVVVVTVAQLLHYGARYDPCAGATSTVDTSADTVLLSVPISCVPSSGPAVRFFVTSSGTRARRPIGVDRLSTARPVVTR